MSETVRPRDLLEWCRIPAEALVSHPRRKIPLRLVKDSAELGQTMARELADLIEARNARGLPTRAIIPCGPTSWYAPWTEIVNERRLSLARLSVFHMDECLDAEGRPLRRNHPYNFRTFMERYFYGGISPDLTVPETQRHWLLPSTLESVVAAIDAAPIDVTLGGWGQDGHVAYNQARRHPYQRPGVAELAASTARIQENNIDTILALAQRTFGAAYQFVPPMSVTLGMRECLSARQVRLFSDTGAWKQTALRVALFSDPTPEYPITLLQRHPDALLTATLETARHP
ncbi:MAG: 6-phosphogluconolactonase, partial [Vicinamibacteria bacterium]